MTGTWRLYAGASSGRRGARRREAAVPLDGHDLRFLLLQDLVDLLDVLVRHLLDLGHGLLLVVLAHLVPLEHPLEVVVDVAAHVADGCPALLRALVRVLYQALLALHGE